MDDRPSCPCENVKALEKEVQEQKERLYKCQVDFATINVKLNMLMAILGVIGTAVVGIVIKMLF